MGVYENHISMADFVFSIVVIGIFLLGSPFAIFMIFQIAMALAETHPDKVFVVSLILSASAVLIFTLVFTYILSIVKQ